MKSHPITRGVALSGAMLLLHARSALASNGGENTPLSLGHSGTPGHSSGGTGGSLIRTVVGLFVVLAVIYGVSWILRQVKAGKMRASGNGMEQVASLPLGTNRSVTLVRVGQQLMLLGIAEHGVTTIRTYTEEEAREEGLLAETEDGDPAPAPEPPLYRFIDGLRKLTVRS